MTDMILTVGSIRSPHIVRLLELRIWRRYGMPGTVVRVKGLKRYFEPKTGRIYCYHRASGKRISEEFGSPAFFTRLAQLDREFKNAAEIAAQPGTLEAVILDYKLSDAFRDLAPRTRADYEKVFTFLAPLHNARLAAFTTEQIVKLRTKWRQNRGRCFLNRARVVLSILFNHAIEQDGLDRIPSKTPSKSNAPKTQRPSTGLGHLRNGKWSLR